MGGSCSRDSQATAPATSASAARGASRAPAVVSRPNPVPAAAATAAATTGKAATPKPRGTFAQTYELKEKLGKGQYAVVHRAVHRTSHAECAVKCIKKATLTAEDLAALDIEVAAQKKLSEHPNFVRLFDFFAEKDYFFIVLELISGGELFDRICDKERYSEREAREIIKQLAAAIAYMHGKGVVHRDLKPENILLKSRMDDTSIKLADLGFAKLIQSADTLMTTPCGTPGYVAPEILSGKPYTCAADIWSMGVIFYILLCGYPPFVSEKDDQKELFALIRDGRYTFPPAEWSVISDGAKDLVRHILVTDPKQRYTAEQILAHPWTRADAATIPDAPLGGAVAQLKRFNARRRLKKTMAAVRTAVRMKILLAARMQRIMDVMRAAAPPADGAVEENVDTGEMIVRAYKAAEAKGLSVRSVGGGNAKLKAEEAEEARLIAAASLPPPGDDGPLVDAADAAAAVVPPAGGAGIAVVRRPPQSAPGGAGAPASPGAAQQARSVRPKGSTVAGLLSPGGGAGSARAAQPPLHAGGGGGAHGR